MQYLKVFSTRKMAWSLCLSLLISSSSFLFADEGDEIIQELTSDCESLAKDMTKRDKKFLSSHVKNIRGLVVWRSSRCEKPPKGDGTITNLCEGDIASGGSTLFWQHKTKAEKLRNGFLICE